MRKNENGRSMIEMLGVLAIIGVLSVGGIYGYTVAMRKYKANEIVQTISMLATLAKSANAGQGIEAAGLKLSDSGLETSPAGESIGNTIAKCVDKDNNLKDDTTYKACDYVKVQVVGISGDLLDAVLAIAPTKAPNGASTDAATVRAGYYALS